MTSTLPDVLWEGRNTLAARKHAFAVWKLGLHGKRRPQELAFEFLNILEMFLEENPPGNQTGVPPATQTGIPPGNPSGNPAGIPPVNQDVPSVFGSVVDLPLSTNGLFLFIFGGTVCAFLSTS